MAKLKVKGSVLSQDIASSMTAIAQITSISTSGAESETVEADTLDNADAGIPYEPTGRSEGGSVEVELIYDPGLAGHQSITDFLTTPADRGHQVTYADSTTAAFTAAGVGFDQTLAQGDLVRASVSYKVDGLITYPT